MSHITWSVSSPNNAFNSRARSASTTSLTHYFFPFLFHSTEPSQISALSSSGPSFSPVCTVPSLLRTEITTTKLSPYLPLTTEIFTPKFSVFARASNPTTEFSSSPSPLPDLHCCCSPSSETLHPHGPCHKPHGPCHFQQDENPHSHYSHKKPNGPCQPLTEQTMFNKRRSKRNQEHRQAALRAPIPPPEHTPLPESTPSSQSTPSPVHSATPTPSASPSDMTRRSPSTFRATTLIGPLSTRPASS